MGCEVSGTGGGSWTTILCPGLANAPSFTSNRSSHTLTIHTHTTYGLLFALPLIDVQFTFPSTLRLTLQSCEADDEAADGADDSAEVDVGMYTDDEASSTVPGSQPAQGTGAFATDSGVVPERQTVGEDLDADDAAEAGQDDDGRVYYITRWEEEGVLDKAINAVGVVRKMQVLTRHVLLAQAYRVLQSTVTSPSSFPTYSPRPCSSWRQS